MEHKIDSNSQRNNFSFKGKFKAYWQCFTTSAWMLMSFYSKYIVSIDDKELSKYLDDVEISVGKPGIGEKVKRKFKWISGSTSFWWLVQKAGIEKWLHRNGVSGRAVFTDKNAKIKLELLVNLINKGPVILQTNKMGGLKGGHIILLIGHTIIDDEIVFIVNDPFGNAITKYRSSDGDSKLYPLKWLKQYTGNSCRYIYWEK